MKTINKFSNRRIFRLLAVLILGCCAAQISAQTTPPPAAAQGETIKVSGALFTNFIGPTNGLGMATGDLRGAIAATILKWDQATGTGSTQHYWVTEAGDQLFIAPVDFKFVPGAADPALGLVHVFYPEAPAIIGGTGKFEGATGRMIVHGSGDLVKGQAVFRYSGTITLKSASAAPAIGASTIQNGQFRFQVQAPNTRQITTETSENLKEWKKLDSKAPVNGAAVFTDPATQPQRFYRAQGE